MSTPTPSASRRFISLKWKTLALVSVVLATVHLGLVLQGYYGAIDQFESRQSLAFEERIHVLKKLLDQSAARLSRIANIVPGVINTLTVSNLEERWQAVQIELQLEVMQLYGKDGVARIVGLPMWENGAPPAALRERIQAALREERPAGFLLCQPHCVQYNLVPVLGTRGERQLMVLGLSLADVVLEFPGLAGADVALLVEQPTLAPLAAGAAAYWDRYRLVAVSDAPSNEPKLRALSRGSDMTQIEQGRGLSFGGRQYRFYARPLAAFGSLTPGYFLVFDDTTQALSDIRRQLQSQLLVGLIALLAALALLLSVLNRPMNQLRKLAQTLPMLAHSQYAPVRELIGKAYLSKRTHSEIDVLEEVTVELSRKLEELEQTVAARSQALAASLTELKRANELNDKIFATAPLIFLIQSQDGRVLQINAFGSQLLGYSESEIQNQPFVSLLADARQRLQASDVLTDVIGGRRQLFEQSGPVTCVDGALEHVTWLHTRLAAQSGNYVLSVGLPDKSLEGQQTH
jgi:PAS domain-containing protein